MKVGAALSPRVGIDIGGTFTDLVLIDGDGNGYTHKLLSTPPDYGRAIKVGLNTLLRNAGFDAYNLADLVHATTVVTNAVIEKKGARTALVTTKGFRDVLELRRLRLPRLYE